MQDKESRKQADHYFNSEGLFVFTERYLLRRGFCCGNGCRHCPYDDEGKVREEWKELSEALKAGDPGPDR